MFRRASTLANRLLPFLPKRGLIADVGAGTGHNAVVLRQRSECEIRQWDVADMHWVGEGAEPISDDYKTPFLAGQSVQCVLLIYVLQYPQDPVELLNWVLNEEPQQLLVMQSTYRNRWGKCVFRIQEAIFGPLAFHVARLLRLVPHQKCSVNPIRYFQAADMVDLLTGVGLQVCHRQAHSNWLLGTGSDLFVCRRETV
ncbi:MAG: methyltransferase domain-containing protein [Fuerstiella sp.]